MKDFLWGLCLKRLKKWSRSGLLELVKGELSERNQPIVLSVGGFGPVDRDLRNHVIHMGGRFVTFDIDPSHSPELLGDIKDISSILNQAGIIPDVIVALEVLEHIPNPSQAIDGCYSILPNYGTLILSTPWIIPIHDRPHDYFRFTPAALQLFLKDFTKVSIYARGDYQDAIVVLLLRGLFSGGLKGKLIMIFGLILSSFGRLPSVHKDTDSIDSCIGYVSSAKKII